MMQVALLLVCTLLTKLAASTQRICIVVGGNNENCNVDVEDVKDLDNFTVATLEKCHTLAAAIDSSNEVDFEIAKDHMDAWLNIANFRRKEFRNYLRIQQNRNGSRIKLHITGKCGSDLSREQNHKGYLEVGSNVLDIFNSQDWNSQVGDKVINNILISEYVWAQELLVRSNGMHNFKNLIDNALEYTKAGPGNAILFSTPQYAMNDRLEVLLNFLQQTYGHLHSSYIKLDSWKDATEANHFEGINALVALYPEPTNPERPSTHMHKELCATSKFCVQKTYVVNMDKRIDRFNKFKKYAFGAFGMVENRDFVRFRAIDGKSVNMQTPFIQSLFKIDIEALKEKRNPYRDHGFRPGVIGCSLSNIAIWVELANRDDLDLDEAYMILEDDVWFSPSFVNRWKVSWLNLHLDKKWDYIYLGYSTDYDIYGDTYVFEDVKMFSPEERSYGGGTFGYAIRKKAAIKLLEKLRIMGVQSAIDWFMIQQAEDFRNFTIYKTSPLLVHTTPVLHTTSDTTSSYPENIINVRAINALAMKNADECFSDKRESRSWLFNSSHLKSIATTINPIPDELEASSLIEPSIIVNVDDENNVEKQIELSKALSCAHLCLSFGSSDATSKNSTEASCKHITDNLKFFVNEFQINPGTENIYLQSYLEMDGVIVEGSRSRVYERAFRPSVRVLVQTGDDTGEDDSTGLYQHIDMRSTSTRFEFVFDVVDQNIVNPHLWRLCFKLSSVWFPLRNFGCQPVVPGISLSNLHYGKQTLQISVMDFIENKTYSSTNHTFLVSPIKTPKKESKFWDMETQTCKQHQILLPGSFQDATGQHLSSTGIIVLAHRKAKSIIQSLNSWNENGLLNLVNERIIFLQNCVGCDHGSLASESIQLRELLQKYNFTVVGSESNIGFEKALSKLVQTATSKNLLFLEEDWQIRTNQVRNELQLAEQMLDANFVDVVKLRSSADPGRPYCSAVWQGFEHLMQDEAMQGGDGVLSILNAASWQQDDARVRELFDRRVWRCHPNFLCGHSPVSAWTNNPSMYRKSWFVENMLEVAESSYHFESSINLSPHLWSTQCWIVAQGRGLFTHVDLDKNIEDQSPCEVPDIIKNAR